MLDSVVSSLFNVIAVVFLAFRITFSDSFSKLDLVVLILNSILVFVNIAGFKLTKRHYDNFREKENNHGVNKFLEARNVLGTPAENAYQSYETTKGAETIRATSNIYSLSEVPEYVEVQHEHSSTTYEAIGTTHEEIYSDVETYDTIHKPESDQYDPISFL